MDGNVLPSGPGRVPPPGPRGYSSSGPMSWAKLLRARLRRLFTVPRLQPRSEEHTSELQSLAYLVCRLLLEKKKKKKRQCCVVDDSQMVKLGGHESD